MAEIGNTRQLSPLLPDSVVDLATHRQSRQRVVRVLSAAAALILIAIGAFVVGRTSDGDSFAGSVEEMLARPDTQVTTLQGAGEGSFRVYWSPSANEIAVQGDDLPDPGAGKAYELWLVDGTGAHAVRLLDKADDETVRRVLSVNGSPTQWAITVEPEGGVDEATGDIIFSGAV